MQHACKRRMILTPTTALHPTLALFPALVLVGVAAEPDAVAVVEAAEPELEVEFD